MRILERWFATANDADKAVVRAAVAEAMVTVLFLLAARFDGRGDYITIGERLGGLTIGLNIYHDVDAAIDVEPDEAVAVSPIRNADYDLHDLFMAEVDEWYARWPEG